MADGENPFLAESKAAVASGAATIWPQPRPPSPAAVIENPFLLPPMGTAAPPTPAPPTPARGRAASQPRPTTLQYAGMSAAEVAADLAARERALASREATVAAAMLRVKPYNFPASWLGLTRLAIDEDIPEAKRRMVRLAYSAWLVTALAYVWNFLIISIALGSDAATVATWFLAAAVAVIGVPVSFATWFKALYAAAAAPNASLLLYTRFFFCIAVHLAACLWILVSPPVVGLWAAGVLRLFAYLRAGSTILPLLTAINVALFTAALCSASAALRLAVAEYRSRGGGAELRRQSVGPPADAV